MRRTGCLLVNARLHHPLVEAYHRLTRAGCGSSDDRERDSGKPPVNNDKGGGVLCSKMVNS
jgi:hypothetical protein